MPSLGVNIDHVATLRQARYRDHRGALMAEPDPIQAARIALAAGACGITAHLREDRRHIQDHDIQKLRRITGLRLNLEMAVTPAMERIALRLRPHEICLVPENRREVTTEGGLDVASRLPRIRQSVRLLSARGITVSLFIDPDPSQIQAAAQAGAPFVELHTGAYANASGKAATNELRRHRRALDLALTLGLRVNAGHGLNYTNLIPYLQTLPEVEILNIGHAIVSRAMWTGFEQAVRTMAALIDASSKYVRPRPRH